MKILQINKYHYIRGGADRVYFNTGKLLENNGHDVIYFSMDSMDNVPCDQSKYFASNNDFTRFSFLQKIKKSTAFFYNKDAEIKLRELIEIEKPQIAHAHVFFGSLTPSVLKVLKKYNIPVIISVHDYKIVCPAYLFLNGKNEICESCEGKKYYKAVTNNCVKNSKVNSMFFALEAYYRDAQFPLTKYISQLLFVSDFAANIHKKYKPELEAISSRIYNFDPMIGTSDLEFKKGEYFLYAGRLSIEKGLKTLIAAFNKLPNLKLLIAGNGELMSELKDIASENITFLGFQNNDQLQKLILNASFVIVPSEWYENNPMAIIEAYSKGKPVIAANIGGIPEIIDDCNTGYIFESGNIEDLVEKIDKASSITQTEYEILSKNSEIFALKKFSPQKHYKELIKLYQKALSSIEMSN